METVFPTATGYEGFFLVGFRKTANAITQRTGTVVLKRTYDVDPVAGVLRPSANALPIFFTDTPDLYEHDLAPFKPQGDVIVLGFANVLGLNQMLVNNAVWFQITLPLLPPQLQPTSLFGWEPRVASPREKQAGEFSKKKEDYPPQWPVIDPARDPLPAGFQNVFYNGYSRSTAQPAAIPFPYLPRDADIHIERSAGSSYRFRLGSEAITAAYFSYTGSGPDIEQTWQRTAVAMNLDTLVIEPEHNRCYAVWRGVWPLDEHPESDYRRLVVEASA